MTDQVVFGRRGAVPARALVKPAQVVTEPKTEAPRSRSKLYVETTGMERLLAGVPMFTVALAAFLGLVFYIELRLAFDVGSGGEISRETSLALGAVSRNLALGQGQLWRLGLAPLLHGSNSHLIGNTIALVLIGIQLEPIIGRGWFAGIFALSAFGGEAGSLFGNAASLPTLGASGAITGVIAAAFAFSFSADTAEESARMRRRALFFGVPALLPLFLAGHDSPIGSTGGTDYYAHLGGALTGGGVAFVLDQAWDRVYFRPPLAHFGGFFALFALGFSLLSAGLASRCYGEYQTQARQFIPLAAVEGDFAASANRAPEFELKYPHDPLTPLFVAVHDLKLQRVGEAETVLRAAMEAHTPLRPEAEPQIQGLARAFLAVVLKAERRSWEARDAAAPLCKPGAPAKPHEMVAKAKLCDPG